MQWLDTAHVATPATATAAEATALATISLKEQHDHSSRKQSEAGSTQQTAARSQQRNPSSAESFDSTQLTSTSQHIEPTRVKVIGHGRIFFHFRHFFFGAQLTRSTILKSSTTPATVDEGDDLLWWCCWHPGLFCGHPKHMAVG